MMGETKLFGVLLGLLGNVMIALALNKLIQTGSCGGVGVPACPAAATPYFIMLPAGIIASVAAIFFGGGAWIFLGIFLSVGIGALAAALGTEDSGTRAFGFVFGGIFAGVPVLLGVLGLGGGLLGGKLGGAKAAKAQRLITAGAKGVGTITDVRDTGMTINNDPRIAVTMRIQPADGSPAFDASKTVTVSRVAIPRAGDRFPVWYDPRDPTTWAYGTDMQATAAPDVQALFAQAAAPAALAAPAPAPPAAAPPAADGPADQLAKLNDLRLKGVLTDAEFEAAKARLLGTTT